MSAKLPNLTPAELAALTLKETFNRLAEIAKKNGVKNSNKQAADMLDMLIEIEDKDEA